MLVTGSHAPALEDQRSRAGARRPRPHLHGNAGTARLMAPFVLTGVLRRRSRQTVWHPPERRNPRKCGGFVMRPSGLEPPRGNPPKGPSTWCQRCQIRPPQSRSGALARSRTYREHLDGRLFSKCSHGAARELARSPTLDVDQSIRAAAVNPRDQPPFEPVTARRDAGWRRKLGP